MKISTKIFDKFFNLKSFFNNYSENLLFLKNYFFKYILKIFNLKKKLTYFFIYTILKIYTFQYVWFLNNNNNNLFLLFWKNVYFFFQITKLY